ncbi:TetR family transcriptional regulator [Niabella soli DSM 19437]|uniref:TetR family transcriptional regulator n=2 Tax=Niabella TaxID=379899 RepID=W0F0X1_9BACT|nr:TetR family transcriptional regulator [Niabella soli DSM 19437]
MKTRKIQGPIRDKQKTMQKLLQAVGAILKSEGHKGLKVSKIADRAKVDKKLIYNYFGSLNGLIDCYLKEHDFWKRTDHVLKANPITDVTPGLMSGIFKNQFDFLERSNEMQNIILWELSEYNRQLSELVDERERFGEGIFQLSDKYFAGTPVNFRAVNALLVAAVYYIVLHKRYNKNTFCSIDVTTHEGKDQILNAIDQIINWCYTEAAKSKKATGKKINPAS